MDISCINVRCPQLKNFDFQGDFSFSVNKRQSSLILRIPFLYTVSADCDPPETGAGEGESAGDNRGVGEGATRVVFELCVLVSPLDSGFSLPNPASCPVNISIRLMGK